MDPERLRRLREAKLRALVAGRARGADGAAGPFGDGVALITPDALWALAPPGDRRALGRLLALAIRRDRDEAHLVLEVADSDDGETAGHLARRGGLLHPPVGVWQARDRELVAVPAAPLPTPAGPPPGSSELVAMLEVAGLEISVEHGAVLGEVLGLEVARVHQLDDGRVVLDVGVGKFDQAATALLHQELPSADALARAVEVLRRHRRPGAAPHPLNRLARERWLRALILAEPSRAGLVSAEPVPPPLPRRAMREPSPAAALGLDGRGDRVLVLCAVGVDLELVPVAADLVARDRPDRVLLVSPAKDLAPVQEQAASRLAVPAGTVAVEGDWPA